MRPAEAQLLFAVIERLITKYPEIAEDAVLRADMLEGETDISDVLTDLIRVGEEARAFRDATKQQQDNLKARAERYGRRLEFTREFMMAILEAADLRKWELPEATVFLRNNPPQLVGEPDADALPDDLVKIERKPDRAKIKDALKAGRAIEGLQLSNQPPSVVVTVR